MMLAGAIVTMGTAFQGVLEYPKAFRGAFTAILWARFRVCYRAFSRSFLGVCFVWFGRCFAALLQVSSGSTRFGSACNLRIC